jgi:hypothetical protein
MYVQLNGRYQDRRCILSIKTNEQEKIQKRLYYGLHK